MITFDQLIALYRNTEFASDGAEGKVTIRDYSVLTTVQLIETDDNASRDAGITVKDSATSIGLGAVVRIDIGPPRTGLGQLAQNLDRLLGNPRHRVAEPERHYLIEERFAYNDTAVIDAVARYRNTLRLVRVLTEAAAYLNPYDAEMMFLGPSRLMVPVKYRCASLQAVNSKLVDEFENFLLPKVHKDQKAAIVATTIVDMCRTQPEDDRFGYVLSNLRDFVSKCQDSLSALRVRILVREDQGKGRGGDRRVRQQDPQDLPRHPEPGHGHSGCDRHHRDPTQTSYPVRHELLGEPCRLAWRDTVRGSSDLRGSKSVNDAVLDRRRSRPSKD